MMYEVEKIVSSRLKNGRKEFEVKWKGYDHSENTWEPQRNLTSAKQLLEEFQKSFQKQEGPKAIKSKNQLSRHDSKKDSEIDSQEDNFGDSDNRVNSEESPETSIKGKRKRGLPNLKANPIQKTADKKSLKILAMSQTPDHQLVYKTLLEGEVKWVKRSYLIPDYLLELVQFYESNMSFKN